MHLDGNNIKFNIPSKEIKGKTIEYVSDNFFTEEYASNPDINQVILEQVKKIYAITTINQNNGLLSIKSLYNYNGINNTNNTNKLTKKAQLNTNVHTNAHTNAHTKIV